MSGTEFIIMFINATMLFWLPLLVFGLYWLIGSHKYWFTPYDLDADLQLEREARKAKAVQRRKGRDREFARRLLTLEELKYMDWSAIG